MTKFKKLAMAAVAGVMAGTMALSFTACGPDDPGKDPGGDGPSGVVPAGTDYYGVMNDDGSLNYDVYKDRGNVTLNVAIGFKETITSTSFRGIGDEITLPDGNKYSNNKLKPAWVQMGKDLNVSWNDVWGGAETGKNLDDLTNRVQQGTTNKVYNVTDIFTTDLTEAVSYSVSGTNILNLAKYLDRMPNFSTFLAENPIVYLSLLQDGMNTSTGANQKIYIAPYFDGYDDIERYCIIRHDWAEKLLNGDTSTGSTGTFASACASSTSAEAFMGSTDYTVDALTVDGTATQKITKSYSAVLTAVTTANTPLNKAYTAITGGKAYSKNSGNIVDVMNEALKEKPAATGSELVDLFRTYIDVCYKTETGGSAYSADKRANLFTGYDACWDVDDLVAMLRCVKTNSSVLVGSGKTVDGITPRAGTNDRTPTMVSLACQLYGVRGGTSRLEYTYIDNEGKLHDARAEEAFYEAMGKMNTLRKENLIANYEDKADFQTTSGLGTKDRKGKTEYFFTYDYSQSQTLAGFSPETDGVANIDGDVGSVPKGYYFAPVITPVSTWDVDGNGSFTADEYFRFTESWRSTKTSGIAVNGAVENDSKKLDAVLQFIDYLYSEDGQIVSTFGPMAENADGKGGFWYGEVQNNPQTKKDENGKDVPANYFTYKGVKYQGYDYKGEITPKITDGLYTSFKGRPVNGWKLADNGSLSEAKLNFTNYARYIIGSTLPLGVKDQSFENQLTSQMGQTGANRVGTALDKGVIKGMSLEIDPDNYWFTCVPTGLPVKDAHQRVLDDSAQKPFMYLTGEQRTNTSFFSIMNYIILQGTNPAADYKEQSVTVKYHSVQELLDYKLGNFTVKQFAEQRQTAYNVAWDTAKSYWNFLEPVLKGDAK